MTQNQKFSVKPPSRLEAIAHHADEKEGDCDHQRGSCSDSGTAAIPADGVFGSDRRWHLIVASTLAAVGLVFAGWTGASYWALLGMSAATVGIYGSRAAFWPMPSIFLTGTAAAGAIALIIAVGNLGGYVGPFIVGWIKDSTGSFQAGLYFLAACSFACAVITFFAARASGEPGAVKRGNAAQPAE